MLIECPACAKLQRNNADKKRQEDSAALLNPSADQFIHLHTGMDVPEVPFHC